MVTLARYVLIAMAVMLALFYVLWIFGGWIADRRGQRACAVLKGDRK